MAAFKGPEGATILVHNYELSHREIKFGNNAGVVVPGYLKYDTWCNGSTTTLILDEKGQAGARLRLHRGNSRNQLARLSISPQEASATIR
jgi:hypothetical protein